MRGLKKYVLIELSKQIENRYIVKSDIEYQVSLLNQLRSVDLAIFEIYDFRCSDLM